MIASLGDAGTGRTNQYTKTSPAVMKASIVTARIGLDKAPNKYAPIPKQIPAKTSAMTTYFGSSNAVKTHTPVPTQSNPQANLCSVDICVPRLNESGDSDSPRDGVILQSDGQKHETSN